MVKFNSLENTKKQYPHFFDKEDDTNFTRHLKVVNNQQQEIRHNLKNVEWSRLLEKPLQIWKTQTEPYKYDVNVKVNVPNIKTITVYHNPIIKDNTIVSFTDKVINEEFEYEDEKKTYENTVKDINVEPYEVISNDYDVLDQSWLEENDLTDYTIVENLPEPTEENQDINFIVKENEVYNSYILSDGNFLLQHSNIPYTVGTVTEELKHIIPNDTYLLEITTYDDYQYWKGYPENDYSVKEDNILQYQYNTTFLDISLETISYKRYLVFRVHKNNLKRVDVLKNGKVAFTQSFESWKIQGTESTDFSHYYYGTEDEGSFKQYLEIEDGDLNNELAYFTKEQDEYVFYYPLSDEDLELCFKDYTDKETYMLDKENNVNASEDTLGKIVIKLEDGEYNSYKTIKDSEDSYSFQGLKSKLEHDYIVKDIYDLEAYTVENRYRCREDYEKKYSKRYNGYDKQTNDCFDHDYSLDIIGTLLNVPRYRLYKTYREDEDYLSRTYPSYYDRPTEDDYHYMKRMQEYIRQYNHTPFPVLECWKYYQITPTLRSRKEIIGVMDETSLRYNGEDLICDSDFMESLTEEDTNDEIMSYSLNKATQSKGDGLKVTRGDKTWYETVIVNNCYIVPNTSYRLRYGLDSEAEGVSIRMICYNRDGGVIRTVPVLPEYHDEPTEMYNVTTGFDYTDTILITPKDTVYIKLLLESNSPFKYSDVSFERMKMIKYDNMYMSTTEDYNGNFYEFYCNYEDVPTNIHLDSGKRFSALLQRSLPLTKKGLLYIDIQEQLGNMANFSTDFELYGSNLLIKDGSIDQTTKAINNSVSYYEEVNNLLLNEDEEYRLDILFNMNGNQSSLSSSLDLYDSSLWNGSPSISQDKVQGNAVSSNLLKDEFTDKTTYTLSFKVYCNATDRQGILMFGNSYGNKIFGIITDVGKTFVEQYATNGNATLLHECSQNYFTTGEHEITVDRTDSTAKLYFDNDLIYTFTDLENVKNIFGMTKWGSNSISIGDVNLTVETDGLMSVEIEFKDQNNNETSNIILDDKIYSDTKTHISYDFTTPSDDWEKMFIRIQSDLETELEEITLKTKNRLL